MTPPRTDVDKATGEVGGSQTFTPAQLEGMLPGLYENRRLREQYGGAYKTGSKPVRDWLDAHPGERLMDGESRVYAQLQPRPGSLKLDAMKLADKRPELLVWLAAQGALNLDLKAWEALQGKAIEVDDIKTFTHPGKGSEALLIEKEE
jgi:hypothetical protein